MTVVCFLGKERITIIDVIPQQNSTKPRLFHPVWLRMCWCITLELIGSEEQCGGGEGRVFEDFLISCLISADEIHPEAPNCSTSARKIIIVELGPGLSGFGAWLGDWEGELMESEAKVLSKTIKNRRLREQSTVQPRQYGARSPLSEFIPQGEAESGLGVSKGGKRLLRASRESRFILPNFSGKTIFCAIPTIYSELCDIHLHTDDDGWCVCRGLEKFMLELGSKRRWRRFGRDPDAAELSRWVLLLTRWLWWAKEIFLKGEKGLGWTWAQERADGVLVLS